MPGKTDLWRAYRGLDKQKADDVIPIPGILGFLIGGEEVVDVANRPGYVYARLRDNLSEVVQAFNTNVSPVYNLPVLIVRDATDRSRYIVLSRDYGRYQLWGTTSAYLPRHGNQHSFDPLNGGGGDVVWVFSQQFMPLLVYPSGSAGSMSLSISPYNRYRNNGWHYAGGISTPSLASYKPSGVSNARMVLVYLDGSDAVGLLPGAEFVSTTTGTAILPYIPDIPSSDSLALAAIKLLTGTSVILWEDIYDLRPFFTGSGGGTGSTGGSGHIIQDEGSPLPVRANLNFTGLGVTASDDGGNNATVVNIPISSVTVPVTGSITVYDKGELLGQFKAINTIGAIGVGDGGDGIFELGIMDLVEKEIVYGDPTGDAGGTSAFIFDQNINEMQLVGVNVLVEDGDTILDPGMETFTYYSDTNNAFVLGYRALGTRVSPARVINGTRLFRLSAAGYYDDLGGNAGFSAGSRARFNFVAAEPWTDVAQGTYITVEVTPTGSVTPVEASRINSIDTLLSTNLRVTGTADVGAFQLRTGAGNGYLFQSDVSGIGSWLNFHVTGSWTPTFTGLTVVGAPTYLGSYEIIGNELFFQVSIVAATTTASAGGSSTYINNLPRLCIGTVPYGIASTVDTVSFVGLGPSLIVSTGCYLPSWVATGDKMMVSGRYTIG